MNAVFYHLHMSRRVTAMSWGNLSFANINYLCSTLKPVLLKIIVIYGSSSSNASPSSLSFAEIWCQVGIGNWYRIPRHVHHDEESSDPPQWSAPCRPTEQIVILVGPLMLSSVVVMRVWKYETHRSFTLFAGGGLVKPLCFCWFHFRNIFNLLLILQWNCWGGDGLGYCCGSLLRILPILNGPSSDLYLTLPSRCCHSFLTWSTENYCIAWGRSKHDIWVMNGCGTGCNMSSTRLAILIYIEDLQRRWYMLLYVEVSSHRINYFGKDEN